MRGRKFQPRRRYESRKDEMKESDEKDEDERLDDRQRTPSVTLLNRNEENFVLC